MQLARARILRRLCIWHWVYGIILALLALPNVVLGDSCVGSQPGWCLLIFGVVPSVGVLVLARVKPEIAYRFALGHDLLLLGGFVVLWASSTNYLGLILMSPLGGFVIEGLVLLVAFRAEANRAG